MLRDGYKHHEFSGVPDVLIGVVVGHRLDFNAIFLGIQVSQSVKHSSTVIQTDSERHSGIVIADGESTVRQVISFLIVSRQSDQILIGSHSFG